MYQISEKKKNDYVEQNLTKASYLPEKATFNDLASNKISKKEVTPKKKIIRLKQNLCGNCKSHCVLWQQRKNVKNNKISQKHLTQ